MFTTEQKAELAAPLSRAKVKQRAQAGRQLSYVESWVTISEANRIFGFDGWSSETVEIKCVSEREREIGKDKKPGWGVSYTAKVRVVAFAGDSLVIREGVGAGHGIDVDLGQAHESAIKEAESDSRKRALMTFGNPFGLALYDKEQANVVWPQDEMTTRFMTQTKTKIDEFTDPRALSDWWNGDTQKTARRNIGITQEEADELKTAVMNRMNALKGTKAA